MPLTISTEELKRLIDEKGNYVLIDVREPTELHYGIIPTARNIPLREIQFILSQLNESELKEKYKFSKEDNLIFYCRTGSRSSDITETAINHGFSNARNYQGSIWEWSQIDNSVKRYGPGS